MDTTRSMEYTVIGDMVTIAQRLQARAQGGERCISDTTLSCVASLVTVSDTVEERLKGRSPAEVLARLPEEDARYRLGEAGWLRYCGR